MNKIVLLILLIIYGGYSFSLSAQTDTVKIQKPVKIWVYSTDGNMQKGVLIAGTANTLLIYPGSMKDYRKQVKLQHANIGYENITIIKTKKAGGLLKGLLIGGGIGISPIVFGEGGAYAAIIAFPLGIITGTVVGGTSKKKYRINGNFTAFRKFTDKFIK